MNQLFSAILKSFQFEPEDKYLFNLSDSKTQNNNNAIISLQDNHQAIYPSISVNLEYIQTKYNTLINSDIKIREFDVTVRNKVYKAFILYIDGMSDSKSISRFILHPLMLKSKANTSTESEQRISSAIANHITIKKVRKFDLANYIHSCLIPYNDVKMLQNFDEVISLVNSGNCALFIDTLNTCFLCDAKGFEKRNIDTPKNEIVIRGSQEAFVEALRTNTSMLRRFISNENLIIENTTIGVIGKTKCAICYIKGIANEDLIAEVKYRINNLDIDYILSTGQLDQLLKQHPRSSLPETLNTERPDRTAYSLLDGKVAVIVDGSPLALIAPCTMLDLLESLEDQNIHYRFANLLKIVRAIACFITVLLPSLYIAITAFHEELIPTELLFSIIASRQAVPLSITFEIIVMEVAFELIHEARHSCAFSY